MTKLHYSFGIALGIHLVIFLISGLLIDKNPIATFWDAKNSISLQMGEGTSAINKSVPAKKINQKSPKIEITIGSNGSVGTTQKGAGSGELNFGFEESSIDYKEPVYPKIAIKRGLQGTLRLRIQVSSEGTSSNSEILKSSGHEILDQAALQSIPGWKFQKRSTSYFVEKNVVFQLR